MAISERHNHRFCEIFLFFLDFGYTVAKLLLIPVGISYVFARINVTDVCSCNLFTSYYNNQYQFPLTSRYNHGMVMYGSYL